MAQFRVGQRVKVVAHHSAGVQCPDGYRDTGEHIGREGVIVPHSWPHPAPLAHLYEVELDGDDGWTGHLFAPSELAPLTDPLADAFIERVKQWQPLKEPVDA